MHRDLQGLWIARLARDPLLVSGLLLPVWCVGVHTRFLMTRTVCAFSLVLAMDVNMDVCPCCVQYLTQVTYVFMRNCRVDFPQNTARYNADFQ